MRFGRETGELEALGRIGILRDLDEEELELVSRIGKRVKVSTGNIVMREDELGDTMYFFLEGEVDVTKTLTLKLGKTFGSAEKSMVKLSAGVVSFFGEMAMFEDEPRSATITASTDCTLYEVKRGDFESFCVEYPKAGVKILSRIAAALCSRVRKGNEDVLKLTTALSIALARS